MTKLLTCHLAVQPQTFGSRQLAGSIRDAVAQIKRNTFAAILLQCDPGEKLEMEAEDKKDFSDLQEGGTCWWIMEPPGRVLGQIDVDFE